MDGGTICLQRVTLCNLTPDMDNALIVGIIIGKQQPRKLATNKLEIDRAVWNFTFRDSPKDYVNVTCWGMKDSIFELDSKFQLDDVVEVVRPRIEIRRINDYGEQFRPMVTSPYCLTLTEMSDIRNYEGSNYDCYLKLIHLPTKPTAGFISLADVHRKCSSASDSVGGLDLLGAVSSVGSIRNVATKNGLQQVREVVIFDHTSPGIRFTVWDQHLFARVDSWTPRDTVLFMTDMRAQWSNFHRSAVAVITGKTIITENPVGAETDALRKYAQNAPLQAMTILENMATSIPDPNTIRNVMSIKQIHDKLNYMHVNSHPGEQQFTALVYAMVISLDMDGETPPVLKKCSNCHAFIKRETEECENPACPGGSQKSYQIFDIRLSLTDHTGILDKCRLRTRAAETAFACNVQQFLEFSDGKRSQMKWKYLLERCAVRVLIAPVLGKKAFISILSLSLASPFEVANRVPHY